MSFDSLRQSAAFSALRDVAARLGSDPLQIQGPGGNVSLKQDGNMLVKASGTWLADAEKEDVFTPVDSAALKAALLADDPRADTPQTFLVGEGLRPSIETSFHAALDAPVVLHTHCVNTIAQSVAGHAAACRDLGLAVVPYAMPGIKLARALLDAWHTGARGAILVNHGLIAAADTVAEAERIVRDVAARFDTGSVAPADPDSNLADALEGTGWRPLGGGATTALAFDDERRAIGAGPALYPDQAIFLGPAPIVPEDGETFPAALARQSGPTRSLAILPGLGAAVAPDASPATVALAEMVGEVVFRIPDGATLTRLSDSDISDLLGWDAEIYRQALEKARTERNAASGAP
ncbi:MAG: class II aldolase/adducin family protein [Pseudomonadota bacterium]